jgi:hypothetical protein
VKFYFSINFPKNPTEDWTVEGGRGEREQDLTPPFPLLLPLG